MKVTTFRIAVLVCCLGRFAACSWGQEASIEELPYMSGYPVEPTAISGDGVAITGRVLDDDIYTEVGFYLTPKGPRHFPSGDERISEGTDVSGDGRTFVGWVYEPPYTGLRAFRYLVGGQMLSVAPPGSVESSASGVSYDGDVIVGDFRASGKRHAFRWVADAGAHDLGTLYGGKSAANAVSDDGRVAVGTSDGERGNLRAFRWTARDGMTDLGRLSRRDVSRTYAIGLSGNGRVVVGFETEPRAKLDRPWVWTDREGIVELSVGQGTGGCANSANGDGSVIVGRIDEAAAVWIDREPYYLRDVLETAGLDMTDWDLEEAADCSQSGRVVVGRTSESAFRAVLPFPNRPPVAAIAKDPIVVRTSRNRARVELDGSASRDRDGDGLRYRWSAKGVRFEDSTRRETAGSFPIGTTRVTLIVRDELGVEDSDTVRVVVKRTTQGLEAEAELELELE